jgi:hypothetical protein
VVSEVYALNPVAVEPHVVLSLVLYKMVDGSPEVREDALHMLHVLSTREWQSSPAADIAAAAAAAGVGRGGGRATASQQQQQDALGGSGTVLVLGALQDSYQQFQYQLAVKLARCVLCCCLCAGRVLQCAGGPRLRQPAAVAAITPCPRRTHTTPHRKHLHKPGTAPS